MRKVNIFGILFITFFLVFLKIYSQEIEFEPHIIVGGELAAYSAWSVYAVDLDNDGDIDVLSASWLDHKIAWYENDGYENFNTNIITLNASAASSVYAADVDGDGDMDVLSASYGDSKITWYENDGNENFTIHTITTSAFEATSVYAVDVDSDGDMDVLSASWIDDKIAWYENDGDENFSTHVITTNANGASSVYAADVDGDGDMDVLSASYFDYKIAWYENLQISGINEDNNFIIKFNNLNNFPNPFNPETTISFFIAEQNIVELSIYNIKGQLVKSLVNELLPAGEHYVVWDGRDDNNKPVSSGIYFYKLNVNRKTEAVRKCLLLK